MDIPPIYNIVGSVLKVTASENLDISKDLLLDSSTSLDQLIENQKENPVEKDKQKNSKKE